MSKVHDLVAADLDLAAKPKRQRSKAKPTLASVAKQANKAAIEVARYEVKPDGTVVIVTGKPEASTTNENPWNEVLEHERH